MAIFSIDYATQTGPATVRVRFTIAPLMTGEGAGDALLPIQYTLSGPGTAKVAAVVTVDSDFRAIDLTTDQVLVAGSWTLTIGAVKTSSGEVLSGSTITFMASNLLTREVVNPGVTGDSALSVIRKHYNPALKGPGNEALLTAVSTGDQANRNLIERAFNQLFLTSASGIYLDRLASDSGLIRPDTLGMSDDLYRKYAIATTASKLTTESALEVLEAFYGEDSVRANISSDLSEPFSLLDGSDLTIVLDRRLIVPVTFNSPDFVNIGAAKAIEVATVITRIFQELDSEAYAVSVHDPESNTNKVKIYSPSRGLSSSVQVTGGRAQNALQFSARITAYVSGALPTWDIVPDVPTGKLRFTTLTSPIGLDLSLIRAGDYVNIYGSEFNAANRGSYPVTAVDVTYPGGALTQWFEISLPGAVQQLGLSQTADADLLYFRPTVKTTLTTPSRSVIFAGDSESVRISLPATTRAVGRGLYSGSYLHVTPAVTATSLVRDSAGEVTVTAANHGLSAGNVVTVDAATLSMTAPAITAGNGTSTTNYSLLSLWSPLAATVQTGAVGHTATALSDGRVVLAGGLDGGGIRSACELFAITGSATYPDGSIQYVYAWQACAALPSGRENHTATLIPYSGNVLVCGGDDAVNSFTTAYLYTPGPPSGAGSWATVAPMTSARSNHAAIIFGPYDAVMVTGGRDFSPGSIYQTGQIYIPEIDTWSGEFGIPTARWAHQMVALPSGKILIIGGLDGNGNALCSCDLFDGISAFTRTGSMTYARTGFGVVVVGDKVLVCGGTGRDPSQSGTDVILDTCEVWEESTERWRPAGKLSEPRVFPETAYFPAFKRVYMGGGQLTNTKTDVLNTDTWEWSHSVSGAHSGRSNTVSTQMAAGVLLISGGSAGTPAFSQLNFLLVPGIEQFSGGALTGERVVTSVPGSGSFKYKTPESPIYSTATAASIVPTGARPSNTIPGPYIFSPVAGPSVTGTATTITASITGGQQYRTLSVTNAAGFPDSPGWLVLDFGGGAETHPVPYLGRPNSTTITLDYGYRFPVDVLAGATVTLLHDRGGWAPEHPEDVGSLYSTASSSGRLAASAALDDLLAAGQEAVKTIVFPGDRGLGGEGLPVEGENRLSDRVSVWGGDDLDTEIPALRVKNG